jgi:hypothetical protein
VVRRSSKLSPADRVRPSEGATKDPSLILGSPETALFNLADIRRLLIELEKVLQAFLEAFLTSFL